MKQKIVSYFIVSPLSTLALMVASFLGFGYTSYNLFFIFQANIRVIKEYGYVILIDGAAEQLFTIILSTFVSMAFYTVFKTCERILVNWFLGQK